MIARQTGARLKTLISAGLLAVVILLSACRSSVQPTSAAGQVVPGVGGITAVIDGVPFTGISRTGFYDRERGALQIAARSADGSREIYVGVSNAAIGRRDSTSDLQIALLGADRIVNGWSSRIAPGAMSLEVFRLTESRVTGAFSATVGGGLGDPPPAVVTDGGFDVTFSK